MKSLRNRITVLSLVVLALLASSVAANAQIALTGQTVKALSIERVLSLSNVLSSFTPTASPAVLAGLAAGALEIREIITFNPNAAGGAVTSVIFIVPTGTPFPTPASVDTLDGPPAGSNIATFILVPDKTYVTKNSVMFVGQILVSSVTPFGDYTGAPAVLSFGLSNDTPAKITNIVELISGSVVTYSASGTGTVTLSAPPAPPGPGGSLTVAVTPSSQQVTSPLAHLSAVGTDPNDSAATFSYVWTVNAPPTANIVSPNAASTDVQLGAGFNTYIFTVKATNTKTGQSATGTATVTCVCADHF
jgi:hypothetical protein